MQRLTFAASAKFRNIYSGFSDSPYIGLSAMIIELIMRWKRGNRLKLVSDAEASPQTRLIFDEVRDILGVPVVPAFYRAYAAFPDFLKLHWQAFRPALQSRRFFLLGARLAAECYTRAHNYFQVHALPGRESQAEAPALPIGQVLDYYQYLDPLLLLIAAAQMQAFEGPVGQTLGAAEAANHPSFPVAPHLLGDDGATPAIHRMWEERRRMLDLAFVSDEHRALACWPSFYQQYWSALKVLLASPLYADCQHRIGESAWGLVRELTPRVEVAIPQLLDAGLDDEQIASVARISEAFVHALSGLVLDVTFARIGCEGGTRREVVSSEKESPAKPATSAGSPTRAA